MKDLRSGIVAFVCAALLASLFFHPTLGDYHLKLYTAFAIGAAVWLADRKRATA